jgi:curved DNA-binding protein CbpA
VLRVFSVPCEAGRLREGYRQAVRMYHPDSNSKDRGWSTLEQKLECEEIMKVINERKPSTL